MSLFDRENPQHLAYLDRWRASWTPEKEAELQERFRREGIGKGKGWADEQEKP